MGRWKGVACGVVVVVVVAAAAAAAVAGAAAGTGMVYIMSMGEYNAFLMSKYLCQFKC